MFFGYPVAATANNWLHECLIEMVTAINNRVVSGDPPVQWPDCIPVAHREVLESRRGLRDDLRAYRVAFEHLDAASRIRVIDCMVNQNRIGELLSCDCDCDVLTDLPESIREPIENLFTRGFRLLTVFGIRDENYRLIYEAAEYHVCPYCGCEYFDAPFDGAWLDDEDANHIREDLDHYLPRDIYPFAASNIRNLSPMGGRCNSYKRAKDVLRGPDGVRRRAFYPYRDGKVAISLTGSVPFEGADGRIPRWTISFEPDSPECQTWDAIFCLRERLTRDVLDPSFARWLQDFALWFRREYPNEIANQETIIGALNRYAENEAIKGLNGRDHFRTRVFEMLHHHCSNLNGRLLAFFENLLECAVPPNKEDQAAELAT